MMENAFSLTLKPHFVLKIFKFLGSVFDHVRKRFDKKQKANFKFYNVTTWLTNSRNMLNISRNKGNLTMIFDQFIESNMRSIFLKNSYTKFDGETSTRPFCEKIKLSVTRAELCKVCYKLLLLSAKLRAIKKY